MIILTSMDILQNKDSKTRTHRDWVTFPADTNEYCNVICQFVYSKLLALLFITGESMEKYKILLCELASCSMKYPRYSEKLTVLLLSYKYWLHEDRVVNLCENMRWKSKVHAHELTLSLGVMWLTQENTCWLVSVGWWVSVLTAANKERVIHVSHVVLTVPRERSFYKPKHQLAML